MTASFNAREFVNGSLFSDMHKEAYGSRPSQAAYARWFEMSEAELVAERDRLIDGCDRACDEEIERSKQAAARFEGLVAETIAAGAADRETAIRWLVEAEGDAIDVEHYGMEHFEWRMGLDFGYLAGAPRPLWTREVAA